MASRHRQRVKHQNHSKVLKTEVDLASTDIEDVHLEVHIEGLKCGLSPTSYLALCDIHGREHVTALQVNGEIPEAAFERIQAVLA